MRQIFLAAALVLTCASAFAAEPSINSIERLFVAINAEAVRQTGLREIRNHLQPFMDKAIDTTQLSPTARKEVEPLLADLERRIEAIILEELSWDRMKGAMIRIYQETFTQEEVDSLIAFYESPTGKLVTEKMPIVLRRTLVVSQDRMLPLLQKMQGIALETADKIRAKYGTEK